MCMLRIRPLVRRLVDHWQQTLLFGLLSPATLAEFTAVQTGVSTRTCASVQYPRY